MGKELGPSSPMIINRTFLHQPLLVMVFETKGMMSFSNMAPSVQIPCSPCNYGRNLSKPYAPYRSLDTWDTLFGLYSRVVEPGHNFSTRSTESDRICTLQVCHVPILPYKHLIPSVLKCPKAAGAFVIATTNSDVQAGRLMEMGAEHVNDYDHHSD